MDTVFFFFTRLNNCEFSKEIKDKGFFQESKELRINGRDEIENMGFNHHIDARIAQLYFSDIDVKYTYIQQSNEFVDTPNFPLVFLICDNQYRKHIDDLLHALFSNFSNSSIYCFFHESNTTIKNKTLEVFGDSIDQYNSFRHEKGEPFYELISLIDTKSQLEFEEKLKDIKNTFLGTETEIDERKNLSAKVTLLHKILGQSYKLKKGDQTAINNLLFEDYTFEENIEGLRKLRSFLLND